jgi:hypothetical protein
MRLSINNEGVCHEFSKGANANCEVYSGSMSLGHINNDNKCIYSYNTKIGLYDSKKDIFLISTRGYSNTTGKQQSILRSALYNYVTVYDINNSHMENIKIFFDELKDYAQKHIRARKRDYISQIEHTLNELKEFLEYLNYDKRSKIYKDFLKLENSENIINDILDINKIQIKRDEKKQKAQQKARKIAHEKHLKEIKELDYKTLIIDRQKAFNNNKDFYKLDSQYKTACQYINHYNLSDLMHFTYHKDLLKLTDKGNIITSQRVTISRNEGIKLYHSIKNNLLKVGQKVLHFRVEKIHDDFIIIGCHTIAISDINNCFKELTKDKILRDIFKDDEENYKIL